MKRGNNLLIFSCIVVLIAISLLTKQKTLLPSPLYAESLPYFSYTDQNGELFNANKLKNKISVVDFFFTTCEGPCPAMNRYMKELVESFPDIKDLQFVSFSVDPAYDTVPVIKEYTDRGYLNYNNWFFLETEETSLVNLIENGFKFSADGIPGGHSIKFVLVDTNAQIVGYYDPFQNKDFNLLKNHINSLLKLI